MTPAPLEPLKDAHGRTMKKLRVQLLDACQMRCFYCMPKNPLFLSKKELLSTKEIISIVSALVDLGLEEIRLTGGEPTLHPDFLWICQELSLLSAKRFAFTTNGEHLLSLLPGLVRTRFHHINVSLDSLNPEKFSTITKSPRHAQVMSAIEEALKQGFHIKINTVVMRGVNDEEILDFVRFSREMGMEVRFLELMRVGPATGFFEKMFISARQIQERIESNDPLEPLFTPRDATARLYRTASGARLGFIASESLPFCDGCSRLRLTAAGILRGCLFNKEGISLKGKPVSAYPGILKAVMAQKPWGRIFSVDEGMHAIGG